MAKSTFNVRTRRLAGRRRPGSSPSSNVARKSEAGAPSLTRPHHYIDDLACGALLIDEEHRIEAANESFYNLFSLPAKAIQLGETFAAFAQRAVLNHYDGILDLGTIIGNAHELSGKTHTINAQGLSLTARSAEMPDKKQLISIVEKDVSSMSEKDQWLLDTMESMDGAGERRSLENILNLVVDSIPFIVIVRDAATSKIVYVNRACDEMSGEKREQLIGKKAARFRSSERNIWRQVARDKLIATVDPVFNPEQVLRSPTN